MKWKPSRNLKGIHNVVLQKYAMSSNSCSFVPWGKICSPCGLQNLCLGDTPPKCHGSIEPFVDVCVWGVCGTDCLSFSSSVSHHAWLLVLGVGAFGAIVGACCGEGESSSNSGNATHTACNQHNMDAV